VFGIIAIIAIIIISVAACSSGKSFNNHEALATYLKKQPANNPDKPIKVTMVVNDQMIKDVANVIKYNDRYVSLNISGNVLTSIPDNAFNGIENLVSITIPNSVKNIGFRAFFSCTKLTSVIIPNSVTSIERAAFYNCTSLTSVTIPNSVTNIESGAFSSCSSLASVIFQGTIASDKFDDNIFGYSPPFYGNLIEKYLEGGIGKYTTTTPVNENSIWIKK
jgi:hypothetical protein